MDPILEMLVMDKHTNLFCSIVSDEEKSFKRGQVNDVKEKEANSTDVPPIDIYEKWITQVLSHACCWRYLFEEHFCYGH